MSASAACRLFLIIKVLEYTAAAAVVCPYLIKPLLLCSHSHRFVEQTPPSSSFVHFRT